MLSPLNTRIFEVIPQILYTSPMNRSNIEEIKARVPIEELVASYVKLERSGRSYKARCPFHNEKSASFFVSPERGGYYCFGCGAKGDIFSFVEQFEGLDFRGALKVLAERAGVKLVFDQKADGENDKLFKITEEAARYFEDQFARSKEAQEYIKGRGITTVTRESFRIGWAPEGWNNLSNYLKTKGWNEAAMEKAGLIKRKESGGETAAKVGPQDGLQWLGGSSSSLSGFYDRFRGRIIFPITDSSGRVVAFTGRILKDDGKSAKYLNSPETPLFNKSEILFGLDKAKGEIRRVGYSILVEGQMDLVLSHQVGIKNAIAASGTALTDQAANQSGVVSNLGMVRRLSPNMIIALDSDKAGKMAAMRAVAATALAMGMSVKIADIEGGKDPADLILKDPEEWKNVLKGAKHVIEFELANILKETTDPHKLGRVIKERLFPFLSKIDSQMDKAYFIKIIGEQSKLNEQAVWEDLRKYEKTNPTVQSTAVGSKGVSSQMGNSPQGVNNQKPLQSNNQTAAATVATAATGESVHRLDMVERRMFGLLSLIESSDIPNALQYRDMIKKIASDSYEARMKKIEPLMADLSFEAETFYGDDKKRWDIHIKELISNFEEDLINEDLMQTMARLRTAERAGDKVIVEEMAKKCQILSLRKAEVTKKRKI